MNEKISIVFIISLLLLTLSGCCTRAGVRNNGGGAYAVREHLGELEGKQAESAVASERLNGTIESARAESEQLSDELAASRADGERLENSITDGAQDIESLAAILQRIRKRGNTANSSAAGDN